MMRGGLILGLLALAACRDSPPAPAPDPGGDTPLRAEVQPVMGQERRIAILGFGTLDGAGLAAEDRYPARLEAVLRARGLNARVVTMAASDASEVLANQALRPELVIVPPSHPDDPALRAVLARHGVTAILAEMPHTPQQRPELFQPGGSGLSALGVEELAVITRAPVMAALGTDLPLPEPATPN